MRTATLLLCVATLALTDPACGSGESKYVSAVPYDLSSPAAVFKLDNDLREISGLAIQSDSILLAIQDEKGIVFEISPADGQIISKRRFRKGGDYEGIEVIRDSIFVLSSNGNLFVLTSEGRGTDLLLEEKIATGLDSKCDAEGLSAVPTTGKLIIACKERPVSNERGVKSTYLFDPRSEGQRLKEAFTFALDSLEKIVPGFSSAEFRLKGDNWFKPSALAFHPITEELYVLSSNIQALLIVDSTYSPITFTRLDPKLYPQPEGLAFFPTGEMIIASEGAGGSGRLMRIRWKRENNTQ